MKKRVFFLSALLVSVFLFLPSCDTVPDELEQNRLKWQEQGITDYSFTLKVQYFAPNIFPVVVTVKDGKAVYYVSEQPNHGITGMMISELDTIEKIFKVIQEEYSKKPDTINVTYDETLGFPVQFFVDSERMIMDEQWGFTITEFISEFKPLTAHKPTIVPGATTVIPQYLLVGLDSEFIIILESHKNAGYEWHAEYDSNMVSWIKTEYRPYHTNLPGEPILVGGGGQEIFYFSAVNKGETTITFTNKRAWESEIGQVIHYEVKIQ
jgi:predicted secreted protein